MKTWEQYRKKSYFRSSYKMVTVKDDNNNQKQR